MKRIKNFVIGGIENKVFNLILMTVLSAAFLGLFLWGVRKKSHQTEKEEAYRGNKNVQ